MYTFIYVIRRIPSYSAFIFSTSSFLTAYSSSIEQKFALAPKTSGIDDRRVSDDRRISHT